MTVSSRVYDLLFESKLHLRLIKTWTRLKLFGSLQVVIRVTNDKLQEAEEGNDELQEAGAMTIISMMIDVYHFHKEGYCHPAVSTRL